MPDGIASSRSSVLRSRRKPRLRVIGAARTTTRHRSAWTVKNIMKETVTRVIEVWTPDEWSALSEWERPKVFGYIVGLGYCALRDEDYPGEADDIADEVDQEREIREMIGGGR